MSSLEKLKTFWAKNGGKTDGYFTKGSAGYFFKTEGESIFLGKKLDDAMQALIKEKEIEKEVKNV